MHILIVDDQEFNRFVYTQMLQKLDHTVETANNGLEAVQAVKVKTYDLILMNLQMPIMDGITAYSRCSENLN